MFYCKNCGYEFFKPRNFYEDHGLKSPPYEKRYVCPNCNSERFYEKKVTHCRCCGAKIVNSNSLYCSDRCRERGEKLYALERKRRKLREESPINEIVKRTKEYNAANNTNYSYGQYVALVLSREGVNKNDRV